MKPIRLVCATRASREQFSTQTALGRCLKLYPNVPDVQLLLFDNNREGLSTIYNAAIEHAIQNPAILVFVHDDVLLYDFFWVDRIREAAEQFDIAGLAGNTRRRPRQPSWTFIDTNFQWDEPQYLSGTVGHGINGGWNDVMVFGPSRRECKLLDGLMLIADSDTLLRSGLRFDEQFRFHFYDMDFCRQAELKGLSMGTWPLSVVHQSTGAFGSPDWRATYELYLRKYGE